VLLVKNNWQIGNGAVVNREFISMRAEVTKTAALHLETVGGVKTLLGKGWAPLHQLQKVVWKFV